VPCSQKHVLDNTDYDWARTMLDKAAQIITDILSVNPVIGPLQVRTAPPDGAILPRASLVSLGVL
jgi:hypothetical protein